MKKITVKDLTAQEKLRLICADGFWYTSDLGGKLPTVCVSDGPVGLRAERVNDKGEKYTVPAVSYPSVQMLANSWSTECARETGECLACDCAEQNVDILLAPGVNIKRHPLNGRNFEYFSEEPYLAGVLAKEYISGLQNNGVGACLKHFCCNNLEYNRFNQSSEVDERTLREIYYKPFEIACEAKPVSAMCSYNRINGTYASEYKKGFDVLRNEFGFDGAVYSDWDAVRDRAKAAKAGVDIEFPYNGGNYEKLVADYNAGKLTDEELDACAARVIELAYKCEEMRKNRKAGKTRADRLELSRKVAEESMVLLKNDGALPLKSGSAVAVCGCYAVPEPNMIAGGGSSHVEWIGNGFNLPELLAERLNKGVKYEKMFSYDGVVGHGAYGANPATGLLYAAESDSVIVCVGTGTPFEYESVDRKTMRLPEVQERAILDIAEINENVTVAVFAGAAIDMSAWIDKVRGVVFAGFCGENGGAARRYSHGQSQSERQTFRNFSPKRGKSARGNRAHGHPRNALLGGLGRGVQVFRPPRGRRAFSLWLRAELLAVRVFGLARCRMRGRRGNRIRYKERIRYGRKRGESGLRARGCAARIPPVQRAQGVR